MSSVNEAERGITVENLLRWASEGVQNFQSEQVNWDEIVDAPIGEGEIVIGEVTDPDVQKLYGFLAKHGDEMAERLKGIHERMLTTVIQDDLDHQDDDPNEDASLRHARHCVSCRAQAEMQTEEARHQLLHDLFWGSISTSLTIEDRVRANKGNGLGLRQGWKIVIMKESVEDEASKSLENALGGIVLATRIAGLGRFVSL